ncbi:MAG: nucleotidyl transferase AbiEii/AbiGii toxin family protein [Spirochaetaceae bacterium]|nr:MAG: nucleotidyl transferase AbiEii/AbiGii toxin family protein [Spirochaetaceae bacterium]
MTVSRTEMLAIASDTGFDALMLEKVVRLIGLLNLLNTHPYLQGRWVLKGGTALNLFFVNLPRLSVDIDLNYVGALDREAMLIERPKVEEALQAVFSRDGFNVRRVPTDHAGGKWTLGYQSFSGQPGNLEVDLNFMFRQPLWDPTSADSVPLGRYQASGIPVLNDHELAAGKLAALLARTQARDLFDCRSIAQSLKLDPKLLRIAFVAYGGMNRKDWREVSVTDLGFDADNLSAKLIPTLHGSAVPAGVAASVYGQELIDECTAYLGSVLPLQEAELAFLDALLNEGRIDASLLTNEPELSQRIDTHPMLQWKAFNIRKHKGLTTTR